MVLHKPLCEIVSILSEPTAVAPHVLQAWRQSERDALERSIDKDCLLPAHPGILAPGVQPDELHGNYLFTGATGKPYLKSIH